VSPSWTIQVIYLYFGLSLTGRFFLIPDINGHEMDDKVSHYNLTSLRPFGCGILFSIQLKRNSQHQKCSILFLTFGI